METHKKPAGLFPEPAGYPTCLIIVLPVHSRESSRVPMGRGSKSFIQVIHIFLTSNPPVKMVFFWYFFLNIAGFMFLVGCVANDIRKNLPQHFC